jgi:hypothetical protein
MASDQKRGMQETDAFRFGDATGLTQILAGGAPGEGLFAGAMVRGLRAGLLFESVPTGRRAAPEAASWLPPARGGLLVDVAAVGRPDLSPAWRPPTRIKPKSGQRLQAI